MKLGSSPTFEGIQQVIKAFYVGSVKELRPATETTWTVHNADGTQLSRVQVRLHKGRYLFEAP